MRGRAETGFFTGHRPKELGRCYTTDEKLFIEIKEKTKELIRAVMDQKGISQFVSGAALGFDKIAFHAVNDLKEEGLDLRNVLAVPYEDQPLAWVDPQRREYYEVNKHKFSSLREALTPLLSGDYWFAKTLKEYYDMFDLADEIVFVDTVQEYSDNIVPIGSYHVSKLQKRNYFLVDVSCVGITLFGGKTGGTHNAVSYSLSQGVPLYRMFPQTYELELMEA